MSLIKKQLQALYDDQQFCQKVIEQQTILGKRYVFVEFVDRQDQRQWQEERRDQHESHT